MDDVLNHFHSALSLDELHIFERKEGTKQIGDAYI